MKPESAEKYIKDIKGNIGEINIEDLTINDQDVLKDAQFLNKCLSLRDLKYRDAGELKRVQAMKRLNDISLSWKEKSALKRSLKVNVKYYSKYSNASIIDEVNCDFPLVFFDAVARQEGGFLIVEKRYDAKNEKFYDHHKIVDEVSDNAFTCGVLAHQKKYASSIIDEHGLDMYLVFIEEDTLDYDRASSDDGGPSAITKLEIPDAKYYSSTTTYIASRFFEAIDFMTGKKSPIRKGSFLWLYEKTVYDVVFIYEDRKHRATFNNWQENTELLE